MAEWIPDLIRGLLLLVVWMALGFSVLALPAAVGLGWVLILICAFLWLYVIRPRSSANTVKLREYRVRVPTRPFRLVSIALPAVLLAGTGISWTIGRAAGLERSGTSYWADIGAYQASPEGWLAIALLVGGLGPLVEEFFFRGLIQGSLERRFGGAVAVVVASGLFGIVHLHPWPWILSPIVMGILFGTAVWVTQSVWAGVVLHAGWNTVGVLSELVVPNNLPEPWEVSSSTAVGLAALGAAGLYLYWYWFRGMRHGRFTALARHTTA